MNGLSIASRYWRSECRDDELQRTRRQKHAAHVQVCRLKKKLKEKELERGLLLVVYLATARHNEILLEQIGKYVRNVEELSTLQV